MRFARKLGMAFSKALAITLGIGTVAAVLIGGLLLTFEHFGAHVCFWLLFSALVGGLTAVFWE